MSQLVSCQIGRGCDKLAKRLPKWHKRGLPLMRGDCRRCLADASDGPRRCRQMRRTEGRNERSRQMTSTTRATSPAGNTRPCLRHQHAPAAVASAHARQQPDQVAVAAAPRGRHQPGSSSAGTRGYPSDVPAPSRALCPLSATAHVPTFCRLASHTSILHQWSGGCTLEFGTYERHRGQSNT